MSKQAPAGSRQSLPPQENAGTTLSDSQKKAILSTDLATYNTVEELDTFLTDLDVYRTEINGDTSHEKHDAAETKWSEVVARKMALLQQALAEQVKLGTDKEGLQAALSAFQSYEAALDTDWATWALNTANTARGEDNQINQAELMQKANAKIAELEATPFIPPAPPLPKDATRNETETKESKPPAPTRRTKKKSTTTKATTTATGAEPVQAQAQPVQAQAQPPRPLTDQEVTDARRKKEEEEEEEEENNNNNNNNNDNADVADASTAPVEVKEEGDAPKTPRCKKSPYHPITAAAIATASATGTAAIGLTAYVVANHAMAMIANETMKMGQAIAHGFNAIPTSQFAIAIYVLAAVAIAATIAACVHHSKDKQTGFFKSKPKVEKEAEATATAAAGS